MKVTLITHTPEPEKVIAGAAKLCYSSSDIESLMNGLTTEKIETFIKKLTDLGHQSPLEHCSFTFGIEGISRALSHQLVRHRIASYSQKSQRYVKEGQFEYIIPPKIIENRADKNVYENFMKYAQETYDYFIRNGIPAEDARFVLPNACDTKMILTMNARSLHNFFRHRCCNRAQWEIRELACEMVKLCREVAPNLFKNAGPACLTGPCPEGKMTCGKIREMREMYTFKK